MLTGPTDDYYYHYSNTMCTHIMLSLLFFYFHVKGLVNAQFLLCYFFSLHVSFLSVIQYTHRKIVVFVHVSERVVEKKNKGCKTRSYLYSHKYIRILNCNKTFRNNHNNNAKTPLRLRQWLTYTPKN